jgi:hypothetical protein
MELSSLILPAYCIDANMHVALYFSFGKLIPQVIFGTNLPQIFCGFAKNRMAVE